MPKKYEYEGWDAWAALMSALTFLLRNPKGAGWPLYAIIVLSLGVGGRELLQHATGIRIEIGAPVEAVDIPAHPTIEQLVSDEPRFVFVQDPKKATWEAPNAIRTDRKFLGFFDEAFQIWKKAGADVLIIYSVKAGRAREAPAPGLFASELYNDLKK